jgi:hypothetical protein
MSPNFRDALGRPADPLAAFDAAPAGDDLAAFDAATGQTHVPAGWYAAAVAKGQLGTTRSDGRPCYRLALDLADGPQPGLRVWRTFTFDTPANANRTKGTLAPLGLRTSADLRQPYPGPGRAVTVRVLLGVNTWQGQTTNTVERLELVDDHTAPANPNAVDLDAAGGGAA